MQWFCDNQPAVFAVNRRSCQDGQIMGLIRCLFFVEVWFSFEMCHTSWEGTMIICRVTANPLFSPRLFDRTPLPLTYHWGYQTYMYSLTRRAGHFIVGWSSFIAERLSARQLIAHRISEIVSMYVCLYVCMYVCMYVSVTLKNAIISHATCK